MYVCIYIYIYIYKNHIYIYIYVYVCVYIYIYIHIVWHPAQRDTRGASWRWLVVHSVPRRERGS